jgi:hypothetical protein
MKDYDAFEQAYKNGHENGFTEAGVHIVEGCSCVSNAKVYGLEDSVRRAKFPMATNIEVVNKTMTDGIRKLAQCGKGEGHDQWLTGVVVQFDLTFSNKAWVEAERYHFLDFVSSQSTMHKLANFNLDDAYNKYVDPRIVEIMKEKVRNYNDYVLSLEADMTPQSLQWREETEKKKADLYLELLYSNPAGFTMTAGMTTNYRQLKTIYSQRKNHRLPEWREFCAWIETLPMSYLITGGKEK